MNEYYLGHHVHDCNSDIVDERVLLRIAEIDDTMYVVLSVHDYILLVKVPMYVADLWQM